MIVAKDPAVPALDEASRTLISVTRHGVLSTVLEDGTPFGSVAPYATDEDGDLLLLLSDLAVHAKNIRRADRASILVTDGALDGDALTRPRVTVVGRVECLERDEDAQRHYLAAHPKAERYLALGDFRFYRLTVERARYIAGFGRMGWVTRDRLGAALADPVAAMAAGAVAHMNEDHGHNLLDYARVWAGAGDDATVTMTGLDRLGFDLLIVDGDEMRTARLAFEVPLTHAREVRTRMVDLAKAARKVLAD